MHNPRFNAGYANGRKRPSMQQRRDERDREAARNLTLDSIPAAHGFDAERDIHLGTIDGDFESMGEREIRLAGATISFGYGAPIAHRDRAA